jgi:hypothetical protein
VVFSETAVKGLVVSNVPPPLLGFNNNVRHRGRIFHIQTEDSGVKSPRIVTHLFADGGRIIKTTRTEYTEHVARADMQVYVRSLMKEQHKAMFTALRLGELDTLLENVCGPFELPAQGSKAPPPAVTSPPPSEMFVEPFVTERAPAPHLESESPHSGSFSEEERPSEVARRRKRALSNPNLRKVTPSVPPLNAAAFELDVAALERLPSPVSAAPVSRLERTAEPPSARPLRKSNPAPARKSRPSPAQAPGKAGPPPSLSRPSSRFAAGPSKTAQSIFGDGVISEQSLDEVILSYLAEDLDGSSE